MSSPNFGPMADFMGRVRKVGQVMQHPLDAISEAMPHQQSAHDAAIQQMGQQQQADRVRQATQSYTAPKIEEQKRPLKAK